MARVLLVSKFKKFQGGVERHVYDLMNGLTERGHEVELFSSEDVEAAGGVVFSASATGFAKVKSGQVLLWNSRARALIRRVVKEFRPDIVHYHSIYHQLSPSVLGAFGVPTVMTLHDYKLSAPCYTLYRDGEICQACVGKALAVPAIRYKCVSRSAAASALCATEDVMHRRRHRSEVGRFIVPSRFAFDVAIRGGLPADRVSIIPWGIASAGGVSSHESKVAFFGGRLHPTKGLEVLLDAWQSLPTGHGCVLRIAGEGELEPLVRETASVNTTVQFLGMLPSEGVMKKVRTAAIAVVPSLFPETMGLSALEALVAGTPVLSSGRGALADLSGPGVWTLPSVDVPAMRAALVSLLLEGQAEVCRQDLSARDLSRYDFDRMIDAIEAEYCRVSDEHRHARRGG
jgi:glycosyltransferase involved in cell wall biosynthesis